VAVVSHFYTKKYETKNLINPIFCSFPDFMQHRFKQGKDQKLYSLTTPLYLGMIITAIPKYTKDQLKIVAKNAKGEPLKTKVEALEMPKENAAEMLAPNGIVMDRAKTSLSDNSVTEIKEWQAIMDYLRNLPVKQNAKLPVIPVDKRAAEVRAIKTNI
jgi:5'-nucleotidase/UDP-sugar diphosphatase